MVKKQVIENLAGIVGPDNVVTDEEVLKHASIDRFLKYQDVCEAYTKPVPTAIVKVHSAEEVSKVLAFANENRISIIPSTGKSSIEGGLETAVEGTVILDGSEMDRILDIDTYNMQVTCECGVGLELLENKLRAMGYTTGHSPQSKPLAMMGGLVATRSIGQFSTLYGGIEDMLVGLEAVFPDGRIARIKNVPRRAAGPDIRNVIMGSEGALCFITEVTVKLFKYRPENNIFLGYTLTSMKTGFEILRDVMVEGYKPSVARLYDPQDGNYYFSHFADGKCVLVFMTEGTKEISEVSAKAIDKIVTTHGGCEKVESRLIEEWFNNLNWDPIKIAQEREEIQRTQNIGFTTEVSGSWSIINTIYENCVRRVSEEIPDITLMGGHSSHSYINGTNMYFMYYYNLVDVTPEEEITKYHNPINTILVEETLKAGGSMVHHHGVGKHRTQWIKEEYGSSYFILETLKKAFDPNGIMNPGTIYPME